MAGPDQAVGGLKASLRSARWLRLGMNLWPPMLASGIRIQQMDSDFRFVRVRLAFTPLTTNYVGTQFGGSLFAMTDPFWLIMVLRNLGPAYTVWDRAGQISFDAPARGPVTAEFRLTEDVLTELRDAAADGDKVLRWFETELRTDDGVVAVVRKQVYVRKKRAR